MTDAARNEVQISPSGEPHPLPPQKNWAVSLFMGDSGLRTGWRLFLFFTLVIGLAIAGSFLLRRFGTAPQRGVMTPVASVLGETLSVLSVIVATAVAARFEHRSLGSYGLALRPGFLGRFMIGSMWGIVPLSLLMLVMRTFHAVDFSPSDLSGSALFRAAILWAIAFTFTGIFEECFFRGYPLYALTRSTGFWPAAIITSLIFALIHISNSGEAVVGIIAAFFAGLVFCLMVRRTGDLWFAIGSHFAWNYGETFVFGVSDSGFCATGHLLTSHMHGSHWLTGGSVGPEGSLLAFLALGFMALTFHLAYPHVRLNTDDSFPRFSWRG